MKKLITILCAAALLTTALIPAASAAEHQQAPLSAAGSATTGSDSPETDDNTLSAVGQQNEANPPLASGKLTKKQVGLLSGTDDEVSTQETKTLWFTPDYENIPFVDADYMLEEIKTGLVKQELTVAPSADGSVVTFTAKYGVKAVLDSSKKTITFPDYDLFTANGDVNVPNLLGNTVDVSENKEQLMKLLPRSKYSSGAEKVFKLSDYDIPVLFEDGKLYIPMTTFYDIFILPHGRSNLVYNGKNLFETATDAFFDESGKMNALGKAYFNTDKTAVPEVLTNFNYHELCLMMDTNYGLKHTHGITTFDAYFTQTGLKKELLSRDATRMEIAMKSLVTRFIADIHTRYYTPSPYFDYENKKDLLNDPSLDSTNYNSRRTTFDTTPNVRTKNMGEVKMFQKIGDTLFVTFDAISMLESGSSYYDPFVRKRLYTEGNLASDNVALFSYLQTELDGEFKGVKNIVIDISCNSGGYVPAICYLLDTIIGKSDIEIYRESTGSLQNYAVDCDLNLDGKIDSNDKSLRERGMNISVITSDRTFSAANALACYLKYLDRDVLILGQTSGGGSCIVSDAVTAAGTSFRISSPKAFVTRQNGKITDLEDGVRPDIALSTTRMYDREYITELVDKYFKTESKPAVTALLGDVDGDGRVSVLDATYTQRDLAGTAIPFKLNAKVADTDKDGTVTVLDATFSQRWLAGLKSNDDIGKAIS